MNHGKHASLALASLVALTVAGCSGGGSSDANSISSAVQNLTVDPSGRTTVVSFGSASGLSGATTASFTAESGAQPVSVSVSGSVATIVWDERVTPSTRVRAIGLPSVTSSYVSVTTSDSSAPTWSITSAAQTPGLGGDQIEIEFDGPWVVEADVETSANWSLRINGTQLDLDGTTFDFSPLSQALTITLGDLANLHADFELRSNGLHSVADVTVATTSRVGAAVGDSLAPTLSSVEQNLSEDEFGRVVDFTFSEAMDPVFAAVTGNFSTGSLDKIATSVEQPFGSPETLRVTFSGPIVPGRDEVTLSGMVDAHGNAYPDGAQAVAQSTPVANDYSTDPSAVTVSGLNNDQIVIETAQALDPTTAVLPASWLVTVGGTPLDLTNAEFSYDLLSKTLTITLTADIANGETVAVTGVAALDVDGDTFTSTRSVLAIGDTTAPTISGAIQNRVQDQSGATVDVSFDETVSASAAETEGNWTTSSTHTCLSATRLPNQDTVRLVFDSAVVPGVHTLGCSSVQDTAGNTMTAVTGITATSTDGDAPITTSISATAVAGVNNDVVTVSFDDIMWTGDVSDASKWILESPVGTSVSLVGATISWNEDSKTATVVLANGTNLTRGTNFSIAFAGMRDVGGNAHLGTTATGSVASESILPFVTSIVRDGSTTTRLGVRFSEHCRDVTDVYNPVSNPSGSARFVLNPVGGGTVYPTGGTLVDGGLGVNLDFAVTVGALDTLDVLYVRDAAGNQMYPSFGTSTQAEDSNEPAFDAGFASLTTVSGELNDYVTTRFDRAMSPWGITDASNWTVTGPSGAVDLTNAVLSFDGNNTVTIGMRSGSNTNLETGGSYTLSFANGRSVQGIAMSAATTEVGVLAGGDTTAPVVAFNDARIDSTDPNSIYVTVSEAVDSAVALIASNWDLGGNTPTSVESLGQRSFRLTFSSLVTVGDTLSWVLADLAGNIGSSTTAIASADSTAPTMSISATLTAGYSGDMIEIAWSEPLLLSTALVASNYSVTVDGVSQSNTGATYSYHSTNNTVRIQYPDGVNFRQGAVISVAVSGVRDCAGNQVAGGSNGATTASGDVTSPTISGAYINWEADQAGLVIDVQFSEDVLPAQAGDAMRWTVIEGGSASLTNVVGFAEQVQSGNYRLYRLTTSSPIGAAHQLRISSVADYAGNSGSSLTVDPTEPN